MRRLLILLSLTLLSGSAFAQGPAPRPSKAERALDDALDVLLKHHLRGPGMHRLLRALRLDPEMAAGWRALAKHRPRQASLLLRIGLQADPEDKATLALLAKGEATPPEVRKWGRAIRLQAFPLLSAPTAADQGRGPTIGVGERVSLRAIRVIGVGEGGALVPVDPAFEAGEGLAIKDGQLIGTAPSAGAKLTITDRKTSVSTQLTIAVIGTPKRLILRPTSRTIGPGEQLHCAVQLFDAAGNRVYRARLLWIVESERQRLTLKHRYSRLADLFADQYHQNSLVHRAARKVARETKVQLRVIEPEGGASAKLPVTLSTQPSVEPNPLGKIQWQVYGPGPREQAAKLGKPLMVFFHAEWNKVSSARLQVFKSGRGTGQSFRL